MASLYFPDKTLAKISNLGLSQATIYDVFSSGQYRKSDSGADSLIKQYPKYGYEVGIYYVKSKYNSSEYIVTSVWKRYIS